MGEALSSSLPWEKVLISKIRAMSAPEKSGLLEAVGHCIQEHSQVGPRATLVPVEDGPVSPPSAISERSGAAGGAHGPRPLTGVKVAELLVGWGLPWPLSSHSCFRSSGGLGLTGGDGLHAYARNLAHG